VTVTVVLGHTECDAFKKEFFIDSLLVRIHFIIEMFLGDRPRTMEL
jgi:hypothetical protein